MEIQRANYNPKTHQLTGEKGTIPLKAIRAKPAPDPTSASYAHNVTRKWSGRGTKVKVDTTQVGQFFKGDLSKFSGFISSIKNTTFS